MLRSWTWTGVAGLAVLSACMLFASYLPAAGQAAASQPAATVPAREAARKNPIPAGKQIYTTNCAPCHGAGAKGNGPVAYLQEKSPPDLTDPKRPKETDGAWYWKLSNGHPPMPKFDFTLLPEESRRPQPPRRLHLRPARLRRRRLEATRLRSALLGVWRGEVPHWPNAR